MARAGFHGQTAQFLAVVGQNLPQLSSKEMQEWIQDPIRLQGALRDALQSTFPVFMTVRLGTGLTTADDFRRALSDGGFRLGDWGNDILGQPAFTVAAEPTEVDVVVLTVADLGFPRGATRTEIYDKALSLGLELCPAEVGPQLRLQYPDQPNGEWFLIGMEPIVDSDGDPMVFYLGHRDDGRWLNASLGRPDDEWSSNSRWAFLRRR